MNNETTATKPAEAPSSNWATWALLDSWDTMECHGVLFNSDKVELAKLLAARLKQIASDTDHGPRTFIAYGGGYWGRGATLVEAARKMKKAGARRTEIVRVVLVLNDSTPEINSGGRLLIESIATTIHLEKVGTIGSILNANQD